MKRNYLWSMLAMMLVMLGGISLTACGDDDDEEDVSGKETTEDKGWWLLGMARSRVNDYSSNTGPNKNGEDFKYRTMSVIDFHKDFTASFYQLYSTESVYYFKRQLISNGELKYDGTWSVLEGHPEWSYFNGTLYIDMPIIGADNDVLSFPNVNPLPLTYKYDGEKVVLYDNKGEIFQETYYVNINPSKTYWDGLRNETGWLAYILWDTNVPLDNSKFN